MPVRSLETTINGASHVIINISGDISLMDANDAASYVQELAGDDANIIFGAKFDESVPDSATNHSYCNRTSRQKQLGTEYFTGREIQWR